MRISVFDGKEPNGTGASDGIKTMVFDEACAFGGGLRFVKGNITATTTANTLCSGYQRCGPRYQIISHTRANHTEPNNNIASGIRGLFVINLAVLSLRIISASKGLDVVC